MTEKKDIYKKSLVYSTIDGSAWSVMFGFGETYFAPFAIFLNASNTLIGLLASLPQLISSTVQILSANILDKIGKRKPLIVIPVILQTLTWIPMFLLPFIWQEKGAVLLIFCVMAYRIADNFVGPAWNSLMGDLVPADERGRYFGMRNRICSVFTFLATFLGGMILHWFKPINEWIGYGIIFGVAFLARVVSAYYLHRMAEPPYVVTPKDKFSLWDFTRQFPKSNFTRFVFYVALVNFAILISGPFFSVYMLKDLKLSYAQYTIATSIQIIAQLITMPYWGKYSDRFGNKRVIWITGYLIAFVPVLWIVSSNFYWILLIQMFAGIVWGGFGLATGNYLFDAVSPAKRARCAAYITLYNSIGMFLGAVAGGIVSQYMPHSLPILFWHIALASPLQALFLFSGMIRLLLGAIFLRTIKEVREVEPISSTDFAFKVLQINTICQCANWLMFKFRDKNNNNE
jgi:MFS family permease